MLIWWNFPNFKSIIKGISYVIIINFLFSPAWRHYNLFFYLHKLSKFPIIFHISIVHNIFTHIVNIIISHIFEKIAFLVVGKVGGGSWKGERKEIGGGGGGNNRSITGHVPAKGHEFMRNLNDLAPSPIHLWDPDAPVKLKQSASQSGSLSNKGNRYSSGSLSFLLSQRTQV